MKLYEISEQFRELERLADDGGEGFDEALSDTMDLIEGDFADKAQAVLLVAKSSVQHIPAIDAEIKRLQDLKASALSKEKSLRDYLRVNMEKTGIDKIECPLFKIALAKPTKSVMVTDEEKVPAIYKNIITTTRVDKAAVKKALNNGPVDGAKLVESTRRLIIK